MRTTRQRMWLMWLGLSAVSALATACLSSHGGSGEGGSGGSGEGGSGGVGGMGGDGGVGGGLDAGGSGGSGGDGPRDAQVLDAAPDADVDVCGMEIAAQQDLLARAQAAGCERDQDCVLIGSCSEGFGFVAVPQAFAAETQALMDATECVTFDGPLYGARCEVGRCVARDSGGYCGSVDPSYCAEGELMYDNPCVASAPGNALIHRGCYRACDLNISGSCPGSYTCMPASVCLLHDGYQAEGCHQCEAITVSLCIPDDPAQ